MAIKIFKTRTFASLEEMLQWMDAAGDRIIIVNVVGTSSYVVTFAEATISQWRVPKPRGIDDIDINSAQLAD